MERLSDGARRVAGVLNDLMSGDNRKIKDAEEIVNSVGKHPGYIQYLAEIANSSEPQKPDAMRKSAVAVLLANVKEYYIENMGHANSQSTMDQNDREFLRRGILDFVTMNLDCSTVYETYMEVMTIMIQIDYPHRWQGLLEGLVGKLLNPRNIEDLVGGLLASNCLIKGFERSFEGTEREALEVVLQYIFPLLEKLLTTYMNDLFSSDKDEATKITALRIVTHCISGLSMSLRMRIPRYFMENRDKFSMWMVVVKGLLDRPIHDAFLIKQPQVWREVSDKEEHPEWTGRTLCMKVLFRLSVYMAAEPYGKQEEDFSDEFILRYAKGYFETCFRFLEINLYCDVRKGDPRAVNNMQAGSGEFVAPKVLNLALRSMVNLLELDLVFDVAKVHLERILLDFLIPLLQVNVRDKEFWLDDQVQLVYSEKTPSDDHNMVKNACTDAICAISEMEVDGELLIFRLMNFAAYSLEHCKNARTGHQLNIRERESILRAVQGESEIILDHKRIVDRLDAFFAKCVVHEMANAEREDGFIRMRALFVYSKLGGVCNFGAHEINVKIAQAVCSGLGVSRDKAVQIAAAEALTVLLGHNDMKQMLVGEVNTMLSHLLHLMKEVELDDLVDALEEIVARFSDSISTTAVVDIITELKNIYFQYRPDSNQGEQSDENADEILRAADSCLDTINSLIRSCNQNFPFEHLAGIIFELLNDTLVRTNDEVGFEKCINLLNLTSSFVLTKVSFSNSKM